MTIKKCLLFIIEVIYLLAIFTTITNADVFCVRPDNLENGNIPEIEGITEPIFTHNFELTYICNKGYRLIGDSWRFCDAKGWTGETPYCEAIHCPDPGIPEHGTRIGDSFEVGNKVIFECPLAYNLIGSFERYCLPNGQWSGELSSCDHDSYYCEDPGIPINGMKNSSNYDLGEIIQFWCLSGYNLLGSETRTCLANREWSGSEVKCVGPYDYDNNAQVSDIFMEAIIAKNTAPTSIFNGTEPMGKILSRQFPGRRILFFMFDDSRSVGANNFRKSIDLAKGIIKRVGISNAGTRASAITFNAEAHFLPLDHVTTTDVLDALNDIKYTGKGSSVHSALDKIRQDYIPLTQAILGKRGLKSIIFILTDGKAKIGEDSVKEAELLKAAGVEIYCIAVSNTIRQESAYKVSTETNAGVKLEPTFNNLDNANKWLFERVATEISGRPILMFAFDVSETVSSGDFRKNIEFSKALVKQIGISQIGTRAGAVTFSAETKIQFLPTDYVQTDEVLDALDKIIYTGQGTSRSSALTKIREEIIPATRRIIIPKRGQVNTIFIFTNGKANRKDRHEAEALKREGVEIYWIDITGVFLENSLFKITSENEVDSKKEQDFNNKNCALFWLSLKIASSIIERPVFYFVFDVSENVGSIHFRKITEFAKEIVKKIGISEHDARAGALTATSKEELQFPPLFYETAEEVLNALDRIDYKAGSWSSASSALLMIREFLIPLTEDVLLERKQKSTILILRDGKVDVDEDSQKEIELLKQAGVITYRIEVASTTNQDSLYRMASENEAGSKDEHFFVLQNYEALSILAQKITDDEIDYSQCGLKPEKFRKRIPRGKILGGKFATEPWPWMAALYISTYGSPYELECGGSIIHEKFILTAAHCVYVPYTSYLRDESDIIVKLGLTSLTNNTYLEQFEVEHIFTPEKYQPGDIYDYDIALLQVKKRIEYNALIRPVCLAPKDIPENSVLYRNDQHAVATGWGHADVIDKLQNVQAKSVDHLKEVVLPLQSRELCSQSIRKHIFVNIPIETIFTERMLCAGDGYGGNDTCRGDSGGPLMQSQLSLEGNIYWTQIGIISWGIGCGLRNTYGYYTHVQKLYTWMASIVELDKLTYDLN